MNSLAERLDAIDRRLLDLESGLAASRPEDLAAFLAPAVDAVRESMRAYLESEGKKPVPSTDADVLDVWKALVKGDPAWNAIRDNTRELVYYANCLAAGRADALPAAPQKMAVRTARHVYLYVRTRALKEGRVSD
ncbi:MAG: hypothetical protein MUF79_01420 [Burkholderiales bacterium]|jgi:hypothetical protein|nr:hypothetical protein [Burkholderiales bacterium]